MPPQDPHERFMQLFLEHQSSVLRFLLTLIPHRADAHDLLQQTAIALWRNFSDYDPQKPFGAWAYGYARVEARRFLRQNQRRALLSEKALEALIADAEIHQETAPTEENERLRLLAGCLERLPNTQKGVVAGYYFENQGVEALADRSHCSSEAIYKILQRSRKALLQCIERKLPEASA
jgi:RNA polymerase sigma-70 factor (ECF subfamily)